MCTSAERCGPRNVCSCTTPTLSVTTMDCRGSRMSLSDICSICEITSPLNGTYITALDISNVVHISHSVIPDFCFQGNRCKTLKNLRMASNGIAAFDDRAFNNTNQLTMLDLDNNALVKGGTFMSPAIFSSLPKLKILRLQDNFVIQPPSNITYLSNIPPDSFPNLEELYLDGTEMMVFGSNFRSFRNLRTLDFTGKHAKCNIMTLNARTFENTPQVHYINLAFCNISYIGAHTFQVLSNLKYLNLSNNEGLGFVSLRNVSYGLQATPKLHVLDYSKVHKTFGLSTELHICDVWYLQNTSIKELYLDNNRMALIERNALLLFPMFLEVISANMNVFSYGPYVVQIGCLNNLKRVEINQQNFFANPYNYKLDVDVKEKVRNNNETCKVPKPKKIRNNCRYLPSDHFDLFIDFTWPANLTTLNFRGSSMPIVSPEDPNPKPYFNMSSRISSIDSSHNVITSFHTPVVALPSLEHLNISNNYASNIDDTVFLAAPNLITLDASNNFLGQALSKDTEGMIFRPLQQLNVLNLSANLITTLPGLNVLNNLKTLNLAFNSISDVPSSLTSLRSLTELDLRQNRISTLPLELLKQIDKSAERTLQNISIDVSNNTLEISCDNTVILEWIVDHPTYFKHLDTYIYRSKAGIEALNLIELEERVRSLQKNCKTYLAIIIVSTIVIVGFLFSVICGLVYRYRWRLRYMYYMAKARYRGYERIPDVPIEYKYDAFVSYAEEDFLFIKDEIVVELEENHGLELCLHQRNFLPGNYIAENILQAIKNSRKIVIVLTDQFLKSKWCLYEYNMARMESIYSRKGDNFIVCIMLEDIDNKFLSPDLIETLDSETFLKYPQNDIEKPYFWEMLTRSLSEEQFGDASIQSR